MPGVKAILTAGRPAGAGRQRDRYRAVTIKANQLGENAASPMSRCIKASRFSRWPRSTNSPPPKRSKRSTSNSSGCRSSSIRWTRCGPAGRIRASTATSGSGRPLRRQARERRRRPPPPQVEELKWTDADFAESKDGRSADGQAARPRWSYRRHRGRASRTPRWFWTKPSSRPTPATRRSKRAPRWRTGRTAKSTSTWARRAPRRPCRRLARWLEHRSEPDRPYQRVHRRRIRQQDHRRIFAIIPALLSKKANAPVMMRISREEEHFIGRARAQASTAG